MQHFSRARLTTAAVALALLLLALPSQAQFAYSAQFAYNYVSHPKESSSRVDPAAGKANSPGKAATKLVHGVVQGEQGVLPGATVWLNGTRTIAVTNSEGEFELRVPADAKVVQLICGYGGLQEEVVSLAPVQALGSVYLLRAKTLGAVRPAAN